MITVVKHMNLKSLKILNTQHMVCIRLKLNLCKYSDSSGGLNTF